MRRIERSLLKPMFSHCITSVCTKDTPVHQSTKMRGVKEQCSLPRASRQLQYSMMNVYCGGQKASVPGRLLGGSDTSAVIEKINKSFMNEEVWGPTEGPNGQSGLWVGQMAGIQAAGGSKGQAA